MGWLCRKKWKMKKLAKSSDAQKGEGTLGNSESPQRRLSNRLEPSSHEFRLAVKLGLVSVYDFDSKNCTHNICVLTIKMSTVIPMVNVRYI